MTTRADLPATKSILGRVFALCGLVIAIFALNQFVFGPIFERSFGPRAAQGVYVLIRVIGLVALAFGLAKFAKRNRFQTLSTVLLVGFADQVVVKGFWIKQDIRVHPADWVGFEPTTASIFLTMSYGYLFFTPLILILAFVGMESTRFRSDWSLRD
jgi:hypothetical protein